MCLRRIFYICKDILHFQTSTCLASLAILHCTFHLGDEINPPLVWLPKFLSAILPLSPRASASYIAEAFQIIVVSFCKEGAEYFCVGGGCSSLHLLLSLKWELVQFVSITPLILLFKWGSGCLAEKTSLKCLVRLCCWCMMVNRSS